MTPTTTEGRTRAAALSWIALGVVYLVWSSTYLGIRFLIDSAPLLGALGSCAPASSAGTCGRGPRRRGGWAVAA